jgi:predicted RNA binding protein YcfA (HicA-like mRNA interferase family)
MGSTRERLNMSVVEKLLSEMRASPRVVKFTDLQRILEHHGVTIREGKGSHCVAERDGELYTIKRPGPGAYLHPKTVKHCLQAYGLWDE